ncbi:recombinase family protein [Alphaproteobacteria bacterium]|nr:recombinase family protein [Alphaproteobacteria bacterium]
MVKKFAVYVRVSSKTQLSGTSLKEQEEWGIKIAKSKGFKKSEIEVFNEHSSSSTQNIVILKTGTSSKRVELDRLEDAIADGKISSVWCDDRSRSFRNNFEWLFFKRDYLQKYKIDFYEGRFGKLWNLEDEDEEGLADILTIVAEMDSKRRAKKSVRGKLYRNKDAYEKNYTAYDGGTVIFAFKVAKTKDGAKKLVKNVEEAKWLKWIFNSFEKGMSVKDICIHLTNKNVKARRSVVWNTSTVTKMLQNKNYTGQYKKVFKKRVSEIVERTYKIDRIISIAQFNRVQKLFERENNISARTHFSLLGGFLYCECDKNTKLVSHQKEYAKRGNLTRKYDCSSKNKVWKYANRKSTCLNKKSLNMDKTNAYVMDYVKDIVKDSNILKEKFKKEVIEETLDKRKHTKSEMDKLDARRDRLISELETTENNYVKFETEQMSHKEDSSEFKRFQKVKLAVMDKIKNIESRIQDIETEIDSLSKVQDWVSWIEKYASDIELKITDEKKQREWLSQILDKIVVKSVYGKTRTNSNAQIGHKLQFHFNMKIVDDSLEWISKKKNNMKYVIKEGKNKSLSSVQNFYTDRQVKKKRNLQK